VSLGKRVLPQCGSDHAIDDIFHCFIHQVVPNYLDLPRQPCLCNRFCNRRRSRAINSVYTIECSARIKQIFRERIRNIDIAEGFECIQDMNAGIFPVNSALPP
jgi:hypothetical protein